MLNCIRQAAVSNTLFGSVVKNLPIVSTRLKHNRTAREKHFSFLHENEIVYPPQEHTEEPRKGFVCHVKPFIKYSPKNMWYIAAFVRGMTVDEAVKQLSFLYKKGAVIAKEAILEAQQIAVEEHNIEYKSNLWIAHSFATTAGSMKSMRRHARGRFGRIDFRFCHYFLRLEEGIPPKNYYGDPKTKQELLDKWMTEMHMRKVPNSL